jgi:hypothetical protein
MKITKSFLLIALLSLSTVTGWAQESGHHRHEEHLSKLVSHYMNIKNALTQDNFEKAQSFLAEFRKEVLENSEMTNHVAHTQKHTRHHSAMVKAVKKGAEADDIGELRSVFKDISGLFAQTLEKQDYNGKALYLQYCPMAFNGEGANWISDQEKIVNPYLGQVMPGCGVTKKEISSN